MGKLEETQPSVFLAYIIFYIQTLLWAIIYAYELLF